MQQTNMFDGLKVAEDRVAARFKFGEVIRQKLLQAVEATRITDHLVYSRDVIVEPGVSSSVNGPPMYVHVKKGTAHDMSRLAFAQMCAKTRIPQRYMDDLFKMKGYWAQQLACENFNSMFKNAAFLKNNRFLMRSVNAEVRGFLSNRYALHLSTTPLLDRFDGYMSELGAKPIGALWSAIQVSLTMALPLVYQPYVGQHLLVGMSFYNSDFGAGTYRVCPAILDVENQFIITLWSAALDSITRIHLGPILEYDDLEITNSARGARTDRAARDMKKIIEDTLSKEFCDEMCKAIAKAQDTVITWDQFKTKISPLLTKEEVRDLQQRLKEKRETLPKIAVDEDGLPVITKWWAATVIGQMGAEAIDPDEKIKFQHAAGDFIKLPLKNI